MTEVSALVAVGADGSTIVDTWHDVELELHVVGIDDHVVGQGLRTSPGPIFYGGPHVGGLAGTDEQSERIDIDSVPWWCLGRRPEPRRWIDRLWNWITGEPATERPEVAVVSS